MLGDFNSVCCSEEKQGGDRPIDSYLNIFRQFINDFGLMDLGFRGDYFTWNYRRDGEANIRERLDHVLVSYQWRCLYPHALVNHLEDRGSDHKLLLLTVSPPF